MHKHNQRALYAVWGVACLPVIAAMLMYFGKIAVPEGRANHGELLAPGTSLQQLGLQTDLPHQFTEPRWLLLITAPEHCDARCQDWLHQLRQIKTALGRDTDRVEYRLVQPRDMAQSSSRSDTSTSNIALDDLENLNRANAETVNRLSSSHGDYQAAIWVADPLGNLVLRYDLNEPPRSLLDDLKRLLKVSKIG